MPEGPVIEAVEPGLVEAVFGDRAELAGRYASLLVSEAIPFGLIGPREADVLWTRHLLNCGVVGEVVPSGASIVDVGSGAGLPGIPLALACPESEVTLVEPLLRRSEWLTRCVAELGLGGRVRVLRGRVEEQKGRLQGAVVTARAVAELGKLVTWSAPAVAAGGEIVALRGERAAVELHTAQPTLISLGATGEVLTCGSTVVEVPTTVVRIRFARGAAGKRTRRPRGASR